jgi:prevent-host-death family protein
MISHPPFPGIRNSKKTEVTQPAARSVDIRFREVTMNLLNLTNMTNMTNNDVEVHEMSELDINVAEAKARLSELLAEVAFGRKTITISRRGKPMARLVPIRSEAEAGLARAVGWLDDDDPFFDRIREIVESRADDPDRTFDTDPER